MLQVPRDVMKETSSANIGKRSTNIGTLHQPLSSVLKKYTKTPSAERSIHEAILIQKVNDEDYILNSKSKYRTNCLYPP